MIDESLGSVKLSRIKQILKAVEEHNHDNIDMDISLEYLVGSCFPNLWNNFMNKIHEQFNLGYAQGLRDAQNYQATTSGFIQIVDDNKEYPDYTVTCTNNPPIIISSTDSEKIIHFKNGETINGTVINN